MSFDPQDREHSAPARPNEFNIPRVIREPETLEGLGYFAVYFGDMPDPSDRSGSTHIRYYAIIRAGSGFDDRYIAVLGAKEENGLLVVKEIHMDRDGRPRRPPAAAILLSFWYHIREQHIEALEEIFFERVKEDTLKDVRDEIYAAMDVDLSRSLTLSCRGDGGTETSFFNKIYDNTTFGKWARTIVTHNWAMQAAGIKVTRFTFLPTLGQQSDICFNFSIELGVPSIHQSNLREQGRGY